MDSSSIVTIILITLIANYLLSFLADILNLAMVQDRVPEAFQEVYDARRYRRSQEYLRVNTRFGWVVETFNFLLLVTVWFGKGFPLLDQWIRGWQQGPVISGLLFIGILALLKFLLSLPFSLYSTFVIEERFGFNQMTPKTFITDLLKSGFLAIVLGGLLLGGILGFFEYAGARAWWYCWIATAVFSLALQYLVPTWIMPLFNKFTPLEDGELKSAIMNYARSIDFPLEKVFVMDGSRRSTKSNAFFTGFGKHKRIVLFDTLIARHTTDELVAILAHEMGHYQKKHILKGLIIGFVHMGLLFFLMSLFISYPPLFEAFYMDQPSVYAGLLFFSMLFTPIECFLGLFVQMFSRHNEYEADRFAVETTHMPQAMATALKKLSSNNLSNLQPHPLYVFLNYSHPPVLKRIKAIGRS